jgi:hypothetical protein
MTGAKILGEILDCCVSMAGMAGVMVPTPGSSTGRSAQGTDTERPVSLSDSERRAWDELVKRFR